MSQSNWTRWRRPFFSEGHLAGGKTTGASHLEYWSGFLFIERMTEIRNNPDRLKPDPATGENTTTRVAFESIQDAEVFLAALESHEANTPTQNQD